MKVQTNPWKHIIVDDFFNEADFKHFCDIGKDLHDRIKSHQKIIKTLDSSYQDKYHSKAIEYLKVLEPRKLPCVDRFQLDIQAVGIEEESQNFVHVDRKDKLLSIVVYGYPSNHVGTYIGTREDLKPLEWKQNRALIFSRSKDTWHKFSTDGIGPRVTFNINLYTNYFEDNS